jgi:probable rRNA maturation factor
MNVSVINRQKRWAVKEAKLRRLTEFFLLKAGKRAGIVWGDVSVVLVDDKESRAINKAHLGHDYATDVISFNFDPIPGDPATGTCGEIIVNVEQAHRLGRRYGGTARELALYIAHGCDHLSGENDKTPAQRQRMRKRELRWLREAQTQAR